MRLIDADALKEQLEKHENFLKKTYCEVGDYEYTSGFSDAQKFVDDAPVVEAEPVKHGQWEEYPSPLFLRCSVCKCEYEKSRMPLKHVGWCPNPNCGAKMDGELV